MTILATLAASSHVIAWADDLAHEDVRHRPLAVAWALLRVISALPFALGEAALYHLIERFGPPKAKLP